MDKASMLIRQTINGFIEDEALTSGAAIAFYTVTSIAPLLLIVTAVAGLVFGHDAAQGAIVDQLSSLTGPQTADFLQTLIQNASTKSSGILASLLGTITLLVTVSGVFGEMQAALNRIWNVETQVTTVSRLLRARAIGFGLVVALGFLLTTSLAVSAALAGLGHYLNRTWPGWGPLLGFINFVISFLLIAVLFGALFKVLPDRRIAWRDVTIGAMVSSALFSIGKYLIAAYLGSSGVASTYGAAGALILLLLWVYYSVQIVLLGAEFTKAYAHTMGSRITKQSENTKVVQL